MFERSKTPKQARVCPNEKRNHRFMVSGIYTVQQSSGTPLTLLTASTPTISRAKKG